jgi:NitT/TauT family transport system substrate-binding protein
MRSSETMRQRIGREPRWSAALATIAAAALLVHGGSLQAQSASRDAAAKVKLQIGYTPVASQAFVQVGIDRGLWAAEGIEVERIQAIGGQELVPALESGKLDVAAVTVNTAIAAYSRGFKIRIIGANEGARDKAPDGGALLVAKDAPINSMADLKGKKLATNLIQSIIWLVLRDAVGKAGVDPASVSFVEVPFPQMGDAILNRQIDGAMSVEPFTSKLLATGKFKVLAYPYIDAIPGAPLAVWVVHENWLKRNADQAARFAKVLRQGTQILNANDAQAREFVARFTKVDAASIQNMILPLWTNTLDAPGLQRIADKMTQHGALSGKANVAGLIWVPR